MNSARLALPISLLCLALILLNSASADAGSATWNLDPTSSDWNTAANWTPNTVPNGPDDTATFDLSNNSSISLADTTEVSGIIFSSNASAFTITVPDTETLTISGAGITNDSVVPQNFVLPASIEGAPGGSIEFRSNASAGSGVTLTTNGNSSNLEFHENSTAGSSTIINNGNSPEAGGFFAGMTTFKDTSSAESATIINNASTDYYGLGGSVQFYGHSTAAVATFTNKGARAGGGGYVDFHDSSTAASATLIIQGSRSSSSSNAAGSVYFANTSTADAATFIVHGSQTSDGRPGTLNFGWASRAANATITATGGQLPDADGASIIFTDQSHGDSAQIRLSGNASLDLSNHYLPGLSIGSIDGEGSIILGDNNLAIGANNLSTTISGIISNGTLNFGSSGSITKIGTGELTLTASNTYTGGTGIENGRLVMNSTTGSAIGSGPVLVNGGILAGTGTMLGKVTVGTGTGRKATLSPGLNRAAGNITIERPLVFNPDGNYQCTLDSNLSVSDQVAAGRVTIHEGATLSLADSGNSVLATGTVFTVVSNAGTAPIAGTFSNVADKSTVTVGSNTYEVDYEGGDGNDLTLTVVPP